MRPRHLLMVLGIMALFGSAYPVGKLAVGHFPPFAFATLRSMLLAIALLPLWRLATPRPDQRLPLLGFCLAMGVGVYATMYGALRITSVVSPIVIGMQLSVPFAVLLGRLVLGERVRPLTWGAIVAAFCGVVMIGFDPALLNDLPALGLTAVSALCYAVATLFARSLRELSPFTMNGWMAVIAVPPLALLSLWLEEGQWLAVVDAGPLDWAVLAHASLAVSLLAHVGMFTLYRHYPVANVIPYYVLMPVFGILIGVPLFAEIPTPQTLAGGAVVLASVWAVNLTTRTPSVTSAPEPAAAELPLNGDQATREEQHP
jgi:O-acetylserine/cysteine efflux transporter